MILLFFPFFLFALNLSDILVKPKSYVKDFYLTEYMKETNNSTLAFKAYKALYKKRMHHLKILSKFPEFKDKYICVNPTKDYIRKIPVECFLDNGLWLSSIGKLSKKDLKYLYEKFPDGKEKSAVWAFLHNDFSKIFLDRELGYYFVFNYPIKKIDQEIPNISLFYGRDFYKFVRSIVLSRLVLARISLSRLDYKRFSDKVKWWLFINEMKFKEYDKAYKILKSFHKKGAREYFWLWQLSSKRKYLDKLLNNPRVNFYTLYAHEENNVSFDIQTDIIKKNIKNPKFIQTDPWSVLKFWDYIKRANLKKLANSLDSNKSVALKAIVLDKIHKYKINYFITPNMYNDKNATFKAFVYAIARQESRFIPAVVSRSYALGAMQMMPFLIRELKGDVFKQFDYSQNVKLSVKHMHWLFKRLKDPLMVAYAYNGGIGFVKRGVLPRFKYKGEFEPFLSMEVVPYAESREYGKKVITNYVVYSKIFNAPITLHKLLKR
ncbi:MAG: lytic transglycosylase domain-containing protein [Epsilonproteobacteria bacterium]|nr:lytic transglycosylase domain-containing protein [Campylobacterota bacterium]